MHPVGFEPTHPKILRPERSALDHSAKNACYYSTAAVGNNWPRWLSWQSGRLLTDRSPVRARYEALIYMNNFLYPT